MHTSSLRVGGSPHGAGRLRGARARLAERQRDLGERDRDRRPGLAEQAGAGDRRDRQQRAGQVADEAGAPVDGQLGHARAPLDHRDRQERGVAREQLRAQAGSVSPLPEHDQAKYGAESCSSGVVELSLYPQSISLHSSRPAPRGR